MPSGAQAGPALGHRHPAELPGDPRGGRVEPREAEKDPGARGGQVEVPGGSHPAGRPPRPLGSRGPLGRAPHRLHPVPRAPRPHQPDNGGGEIFLHHPAGRLLGPPGCGAATFPEPCAAVTAASVNPGEVEKFSFITQLAGCLDHLAVGLRLLLNPAPQ
ncbi:U1 small nuclear ribonucleoprotein C-like [Trachemys scripta elegans]|uniref:U1 small nuclear ribonucleoprotein C-like n=1 Tax=Trachemys scripta elegans TaxID=31138 RepID=UPI001557DFE4|nr:U1 small nuclear ribonucleoprotein C-like [Trachemys scripta elegans]